MIRPVWTPHESRLTERAVRFLLAALLSAAAGCAGSPEPTTDSIRRITNSEARDAQPAVSPDGAHIAFVSNRGGSWQLWMTSIDGGVARRLTDMPDAVGRPVFEPDGEHLLFYAGSEEDWAVYRVPVSGTAEPVPYAPLASDHSDFRPDPAANDRWIVFDRWGATDPPNHDIHLLDPVDGTVRSLTSDAAYDSDARISPDAARVVFHSDRDGSRPFELQVFVINRDGSGLRRLTDGPDRHAYPAWCPDGRHIVYSVESGGPASGSVSSRIEEMDLETGETTTVVSGSGEYYSPVYTPDGASIVFATNRYADGADDLAAAPSGRCLGSVQTSR